MRDDQRRQILGILGQAKDMTVATLREDGWPQATVVSFVHDGLDLYFGTSARSQKCANLTRDGRASVAITLGYGAWTEIQGLSLAARAERVTDPLELSHVGDLIAARFPQVGDFVQDGETELAVFRLTPTVVSILDYRKGFGWTELVEA